MNVIVTLRFFVCLFGACCVTGLHQGIIYSVANQEPIKSNKVSKHLPTSSSDFSLKNVKSKDFLRSLHGNLVKRSLNEDMKTLSELLLPDLIGEDQNSHKEHFPVSSLHKNHINQSLTSSHNKRTYNNTYSEYFKYFARRKSRKQGVTISRLQHSSKLLSNNSVSTSHLPQFLRQHTHLHSTDSDVGVAQSYVCSYCGSSRRLLVLLQLLKNWDFSSCKFTQTESNLSRLASGCVKPCFASSLPCCLLKTVARRKNVPRVRRKTKRHANSGNDPTYEEFLKELQESISSDLPENPSRKVKPTHSYHNPFESVSVGETVTYPPNSVKQEDEVPDKAFGFIIKKTSRIIRVYPKGRRGLIRGVLPNEADAYCVVRRKPDYSGSTPVMKLYWVKSGRYLAMNRKFRLYATKNSDDPNTDFIWDYSASSHDAFRSRLHHSYVAFRSNGKPLGRNVTKFSRVSWYHLLEVNLENYRPDIKTLLKQPAEEKPNKKLPETRRKSKTTASSAIEVTTRSSAAATSTQSSTTETSSVTKVTKKKKGGGKGRKKNGKHKNGGGRRKKDKKKNKRKKGKKNRNKRNKNRSRRSILVNEMMKQRRQDNDITQSDLYSSGNFLLNFLLQVKRKYLSKLWPPT